MAIAEHLRDAPIGQLIRFLTKAKYLQYPEERDDWTCPEQYQNPNKPLSTIDEKNEIQSDGAALDKPDASVEEAEAVETPPLPLEQVETAVDLDLDEPDSNSARIVKTATRRTLANPELERLSSRIALQQSVTRTDLERAFTQSTLQKGPTQPIQPAKLEDGTILVDWYTTDDPANPQNWSLGKKAFVSSQIYFYTTAVYMGSSIYTPSETGVILELGVGTTAASLGLALYVLAYGIGPLLWSPISEIPVIGRNPPYIVTFAIFVLLCIPASLVDDYAGLMVLRFLQGFFGSPCLATGGASLQDMFSLIKLPYVLSLWAFSATCGPALGPIISGFSVAAENWHWSLWEMLWLSGPIWLVMFFCLPETYPSTILLHRAQRLRAKTGNPNFKSQSELDQANISVSHIVRESLWRPNQMMLLDPAVGFTALYTALVYGIYYSFFEVFPLVYIDLYGFNVGELGLTFLSITVGVVISIAVYWAYLWYLVEPEIRAHGLGAPERRLIPALIACFLLPIGLFIFAWTSRTDVHWIASVIGIVIFTIGIFLIIQCIFMYLPLTYPQYAASLFAGNDFTRSSFAFAAILFSPPLFDNLGIGPGVSLLGALTAACVFGLFGLYFFGDKMRARSRFAAK